MSSYIIYVEGLGECCTITQYQEILTFLNEMAMRLCYQDRQRMWRQYLALYGLESSYMGDSTFLAFLQCRVKQCLGKRNLEKFMNKQQLEVDDYIDFTNLLASKASIRLILN